MLIDDGVLSRATGGRRRADGDRRPADDPGAARRAARPPAPARARGDRGRVDRGQGVRPRAASRRWSATVPAIGATCARSSARTSSGPGRRRTRSASATSSSATPPTRACPRSCAPICTSASRTGWRRAPSAFPVVDELLGYHLERAVLLRRELGEAAAATAAARGAGVGQPGRRRPARRAARRPRRPRARCSSARSPSSSPTTRRAARCCRRSARRCSRRAAWARRSRVLDEAIARRARSRGWRRGRGSSASSCGSRPTRAWAPTTRVGVADEALPVLEREDDDRGQCRAWCLRAQARWIVGHVAQADDAWREAGGLRRRADDERELFGSSAGVRPRP